MARVLMKSLRSAAQLEHVIVDQRDLTLAEVMDPETWPQANSVGSKPLDLHAFVTVFAADGAAQCYVASHDMHGRPELALFRSTLPTISNPRSLRSRSEE